MKQYTHGLIIGKFMPFHLGHKALIDFGLMRCTHLTVAVCSRPEEPISGNLRYNRVKETYHTIPHVTVVHITEDLPSSSESSREISQIRSVYLKKRFPKTDVIFSSEPYGDYVAEYMGITHCLFDLERTMYPISGTLIRNEPFLYRNYISPQAQPYYVKKVILLGSESTGKSTMTRMLAETFKTVYVPEMARLIVSHTDSVVYEDLYTILSLHAQEIQYKQALATHLLFVDTDYNITQSYAQFLFHKLLTVPKPIQQVSHGDLYLYLSTECPYIQDGTRIDFERRKMLDTNHKKILQKAGIRFHTISGSSRKSRFEQAKKIVTSNF